MRYLIDANNLAGKLNLLNRENFDNILIDKLSFFAGQKRCDIYLVFDSVDPLGDKVEKDNLKIIYTPRDTYYRNADDKILELLNSFLKNDEVILVTNDINLKDKAIKKGVKRGAGNRLKIEDTNDFILRLNKKVILEEENDLSEDDRSDINKEMFNKFKNKKYRN
ncbi:NYN domain-containing protein [bacterium]|nr:NYN domain-containing protein [bacterium]